MSFTREVIKHVISIARRQEYWANKKGRQCARLSEEALRDIKDSLIFGEELPTLGQSQCTVQGRSAVIRDKTQHSSEEI